MSQEDFPFDPAGEGKVKSFSGVGVSGQFETHKEKVDGELADLTLQMAKQGIQTFNTTTGGPVQFPCRRFF